MENVKRLLNIDDNAHKLLLEKLEIIRTQDTGHIDDSKLQAWSPQFGGHAQRNVEICT